MKNLNNVFVGYTKDGYEHILLKYFAHESYSYYYDLVDKQNIEVSEIDFDTLIPFVDIFDIPNRMITKKKVVKVYYADRNTLIDVKGVFFGSIVDGDKILDGNRLFTRLDDSECRVMDMYTGDLFYRLERVSSVPAVVVNRPIKYKQFDSQMQPKKLLLEMNYQKEL